MGVLERDSGNCPTCGQRVGTFTTDEGTSYYLATAEQEASELEYVRDQLKGAVDPIRETRIARACGLAQAIVEYHDDARLDGIRETAAEIVTLLEEYIK